MKKYNLMFSGDNIVKIRAAWDNISKEFKTHSEGEQEYMVLTVTEEEEVIFRLRYSDIIELKPVMNTSE